MPHIRKRYLTALIRKGLSFKGIVGVLGHRQVGKTTLLELISKRYTTLDQLGEKMRAGENPEYFLRELAQNPKAWPVGIDECQIEPQLFPALKEFVRVNKSPGVFLLSGSVRFSSRKAIRESLTGRMLAYELLPFPISELEQRPMNSLALTLMGRDMRRVKLKDTSFSGSEKLSSVQRYLEVGGLPGICFVRKDRDRFEIMENQLQLMLERDLKLVYETTLSAQRLMVLLQILAQTQNQPINYTDLSRKARISVPSLKKVLAAFESIFLIRIIPTEGDEVAPVCFLEDQGEANFLANRTFDDVHNLMRLAFSHLRIPFAYTPGIRADNFQYRRNGGAYVPLCYRVAKFSKSSQSSVIGFICMLEDHPSLSSRRSAQSFMNAYTGGKIVYLHPGRRVHAISSDEIVLPLEAFL